MKKYISLSMLSVFLVGLTSCLKDKTANIDPDGSPAVVEWSTTGGDAPGTVGAGYSIYSRSFDAVASVPMVVTVDYAGSIAAPTDVQVGLGVNVAAVAAYNAAAGTSYTILPTELYTMPTSATIPKGERKVPVTIALKTNGFDFSKSYVLPIAITSTTSGNVSGNYGTVLYRVVAKNAYEADYTTTGYLFHPTAGRSLSATKHMSTVNLTRVQIPLGDLGSSNYNVAFDVNGSVLSNYAAVGATPAAPASGFFTADQPGASSSWAPATPGTGGFVHSTYKNTYDEATKTFYLHYGYGSGATSQAGWSRQVYEKWVRR